MTISEITNRFRLGKGTARSHMRNLIEIAAADGKLSAEENRLLQYASQRNGISPEDLKKIQSNASAVPFQVPRNTDERFVQFYDLVHMMAVDESIHEEEYRLCEIFAVKFGFRKEIVREMIEIIRHHIRNWSGPEETMREVKSRLRIYE